MCAIVELLCTCLAFCLLLLAFHVLISLLTLSNALVMLINEIFWTKLKCYFVLHAICGQMLTFMYRAQNQRACMLQLSKSTRTSVRKVSRSQFWSPLEILFVMLPFSHSTWSVDNPVVFSVWRVVLRLSKILALLASHSSNLYVALKKLTHFTIRMNNKLLFQPYLS